MGLLIFLERSVICMKKHPVFTQQKSDKPKTKLFVLERYKNNSSKNACEKKSQYYSEQQAQEAAAYNTKKYNLEMHYYKCEHCHQYHLTKVNNYRYHLMMTPPTDWAFMRKIIGTNFSTYIVYHEDLWATVTDICQNGYLIAFSTLSDPILRCALPSKKRYEFFSKFRYAKVLHLDEGNTKILQDKLEEAIFEFEPEIDQNEVLQTLLTTKLLDIAIRDKLTNDRQNGKKKEKPKKKYYPANEKYSTKIDLDQPTIDTLVNTLETEVKKIPGMENPEESIITTKESEVETSVLDQPSIDSVITTTKESEVEIPTMNENIPEEKKYFTDIYGKKFEIKTTPRGSIYYDRPITCVHCGKTEIIFTRLAPKGDTYAYFTTLKDTDWTKLGRSTESYIHKKCVDQYKEVMDSPETEEITETEIQPENIEPPLEVPIVEEPTLETFKDTNPIIGKEIAPKIQYECPFNTDTLLELLENLRPTSGVSDGICRGMAYIFVRELVEKITK